MPSPTLPPERLLSRLSYAPHWLGDSTFFLINLDTMPMRVDIQRDKPSSLGSLDQLPFDILYAVLSVLDLQSLSRLSRASSQAHIAVGSLPAYSELLDYSPLLLQVLVGLRLVTLHSATQLRAALRSERCVSCPHFGPYIFLPTCARCCWQCLRFNPGLRVLPGGEARRAFGLSREHLLRLPVVHAIRNQYMQDLKASLGLVSVSMAAELGVSVHGSSDALAKTAPASDEGEEFAAKARFLQGASGGYDPLVLKGLDAVPKDEYYTVASMPFPSLQETDAIEEGVLCRGCERTCKQYESGRLSDKDVSGIIPEGSAPLPILSSMLRRTRTRAQFLEHIKDCYGVQNLFPEIT